MARVEQQLPHERFGITLAAELGEGADRVEAYGFVRNHHRGCTDGPPVDVADVADVIMLPGVLGFIDRTRGGERNVEIQRREMSEVEPRLSVADELVLHWRQIAGERRQMFG